MAEILICEKICKSFSGIEVLHDVDFSVKEGEIHALVGENGAGKSTLMNIISGVIKPTSGKIYKHGKEIVLENPLDAFKEKIGIVHQELSIADNLTVAENILIGREPINKLGFIDRKELNIQAEECLNIMGISIDPRIKAGSLSVGLQQVIEITKVISKNIEILILDEPTSSLSEKEIQNLIQLLKRIKEERNLSIIFISHKLNEVEILADRTTVLRDGYVIGTLKREETTIPKVINMMIGRDLDYHKSMLSKNDFGNVILKADRLFGKGFSDISFEVREKEILGVFGLIGAGRTEMACALFGYDKLNSGEIMLKGNNLVIDNPKKAVENGICYVTENRKELGLFLTKSLKYNTIASSFEEFNKFLGVMNEKKADIVAEKYVKELQIDPPNINQNVFEYSGGNQQKILISKSLAAHPDVLIVDEPTRGVDVGAKEMIHSILRELANNGMAIIMISSELPELLKLSDRVMIMHEGIQKGTLKNDNLTEEDVMSLAYAEG
ncbi:MAG TPA: sugar ABC transporter ATP-binding protein [Clostridiaceae bacterium]|mgnify:CR=1 FL=1|nr:sugar ABC transporter ATP-binding protein [Clostridiaceae bacterium]